MSDMKSLVEIEYERLGDLLDASDKIAEGLVNILEPDLRTADVWTIVLKREQWGEPNAYITLRPCSESATK